MESNADDGARFSPRLTKSKAFCCVYGCFTRAWKEPTVRFHRFPKPDEGFVDVINKYGIVEKVNKLKAWKLALNMQREVSTAMRVCSLHFEKDDYILPGAPSKRRCLKKSAVPSLNLPRVLTARNIRTIRENTCRKVDRKSECVEKVHEETEVANTNIKSFESPMVLDVQRLYPSLVETGTTTVKRDSGFALRGCIKTNQQLRTLTGIESFEILNRIVNIVYSANPKITKSKSKLEENVVTTFVKLKENLTFESLAILRRMRGAQSCERIFKRMVDVLSECLKPAIYWPTKAEISCNIPKGFKGFEGVRVVLDCIEMKIEKSKKLPYKVLTYSPCEMDCTVKFVTGFTPAGVVSFISEPYGGRMTHKAIFESCNLIKKLDNHDFMMIDRRFIVNDICKDKQTKFVARISYVKGQKQLPTSYALVTSKDPNMPSFFGSFSQSDVDHIERNNRKIKGFKILSSLPIKLIESSRDILTIICGAVNLSSPVLKDYTFEL